MQCDDRGRLLKQNSFLSDGQGSIRELLMELLLCWQVIRVWCLSSDHNHIHINRLICLALAATPLKSHSGASGAHPHFPTWRRHVCSKAHVLLLSLLLYDSCTFSHALACNQIAVTWWRWGTEGEMWWRKGPGPFTLYLSPELWCHLSGYWG